MATAELKLDLIRIDGGTQARARIDQDTVADYAAKYEDKQDMPPIVVFFDGTDHWLADGFHRYHAANQAGCKKILTNCMKGTQREAVLYACGANSSHGLKRSNADKRKAVGILLADPEWAKKSNKWISEIAVVGDDLVAEIRKGLEASQHSETNVERPRREGKDGKERPATKAKSAEPAETSEPEPEPAKPAKGKPTLDLRKFSELETHLGKAVRMNSDIKEHCGGAEYHEKIRTHLSKALEVLATWRKHSGAV